MYLYYVLNIKLDIILPMRPKYFDEIKGILDNFNIDSYMYNLKYERDYDDKYQSFNSIRFYSTNHRNNINSYSIFINTTDGLIYYSGDTREINILKSIINSNNFIDKIYIDATSFYIKNNVHLYIGDINKIIPNELKNKIYIMHINDDKCIEMANEFGFNVVSIYKKVNKNIKIKKNGQFDN